jgi:hypothetical protein
MSDSTAWDHDWPHGFLHSRMAKLRRAVVASIVSGAAWISFTLLYVAFWAHGFSLFQSIIVVLVSLVILAGVLASAWISFGLSWASHGWD